MVWWRLSLTQEAPSFTVADNPAAHSPSVLTRFLSVGRYWALHARLLILPDVLSFDWSMGAVPLVSSLLEIEALPFVALVLGLGLLTVKVVLALRSSPIEEEHSEQHESCLDAFNNNTSSKSVGKQEEEVTPPWHVAFALALLVVPFVPASNLLTWVGFVAAERVLYLPSMGASLLIALGAQCLTVGLSSKPIN